MHIGMGVWIEGGLTEEIAWSGWEKGGPRGTGVCGVRVWTEKGGVCMY